ncbi:MAG: hypothetical protein K2N78_13125 [Oscillospiraceae bacterium]|nr:hypothetical protein [Oscillospiraceae bacterium]
MTSDFYDNDAPMPFQSVFEEEPAVSGKKRRRVLFNGGLMGPMGYMDGPMLPFVMGPVAGYEEEEDEDPNP